MSITPVAKAASGSPSCTSAEASAPRASRSASASGRGVGRARWRPRRRRCPRRPGRPSSAPGRARRRTGCARRRRRGGRRSRRPRRPRSTASSVRPAHRCSPAASTSIIAVAQRSPRARASTRIWWPSRSAASRSPCWNFTKASRPCAQAMPDAVAQLAERGDRDVEPALGLVGAALGEGDPRQVLERPGLAAGRTHLPERVQRGLDRLVGGLVLAAEHLGHALEAERLGRGRGRRRGRRRLRPPRPGCCTATSACPDFWATSPSTRSARAPRDVSPSASASRRACSASASRAGRGPTPSAARVGAAQQQLEPRDRRIGTDERRAPGWRAARPRRAARRGGPGRPPRRSSGPPSRRRRRARPRRRRGRRPARPPRRSGGPAGRPRRRTTRPRGASRSTRRCRRGAWPGRPW